MTDQAWIEEAKRRLAAYERGGEIASLDFDDAMRELEAKARRPPERRASVG
ncbi:MAG TPA: hypothetical protein VM869_06570 [Enhygromyxa sp.]|nr:hypothetical protein [Enhygromyxa sp.]